MKTPEEIVSEYSKDRDYHYTDEDMRQVCRDGYRRGIERVEGFLKQIISAPLHGVELKILKEQAKQLLSEDK